MLTFITSRLQATSLSANISVDEKHTSKAQKAVAQAVDNEVLVCNITAFLEDYGPSPAIARANVDRCKDCLRELGVLGGSEWEGFPTLPSESRKTGLEAFAPLENIVRGIWEFAEEKEKKKRNQYDFKMAPHDHPHDTVGELDLKMGACIVEATCEEKLLNDCILVPFGLKTGRGEPEQTQVHPFVKKSLPSNLTNYRFVKWLWETVTRFCATILVVCSSSGYEHSFVTFLCI